MRGRDIWRGISELWLRLLIARAERNHRFHRNEAAYHDRAKCLHREANAHHKRLAIHYEAEAATLRATRNAPEPIAKRVEA